VLLQSDMDSLFLVKFSKGPHARPCLQTMKRWNRASRLRSSPALSIHYFQLETPDLYHN